MKIPFVRFGLSALDLLFPSQCLGCGKHGSFLCPSCETSLPRLEPPYCKMCAQPVTSGSLCRDCVSAPPAAVDGIRAPFLMEGAIQEAIHALKYRNLRAAAPTLGRLLALWLESNPLHGDVLVPVPLHRRRLRGRGYNQSALLAKEVGKRAGLPVVEYLLVRTRDTPSQVSLPSREERARNVEGSFKCVGKVQGQKIILVDDVVTTGSTLSACATALRFGGAGSVWGLALAREANNSAR